MTVRAILWTYIVRKDGTSNVKIYAQAGGKKTYYKTDIYLEAKDFDADRGVVRKSHPLHELLNSKIQKRVLELSQQLHAGTDLHEIGKTKTSILQFADLYIQEIGKGLHPIKASTCKHYRVTLKRLRQYTDYKSKKDLRFEDVTLEFYYDFSSYLTEVHNCKRTGGVSKHIKNLKKWMNEALRRKLHTNLVHQDRAFKIHRQNGSNKIYLSEEEINKIGALDLSGQPPLELERDRFLVSYFFIMRYSDSVLIRRDRFFQENGTWYYRNIAKKTGKESIIPVKPAAMEILQRRNFSVSGDTNQEANRKLKIIAAMAGVNQQITEGERSGPKSNFVTTHTARRSAATNLYLQGVSIKIIADLGGWEDINALRVYLRASGIESARAAKDLDFFK